MIFSKDMSNTLLNDFLGLKMTQTFNPWPNSPYCHTESKRMSSKAKFSDYVKHLFCYGGHKRTINRLAMYISLLAKRAFVKQGVRQGCILTPTPF